MKKVMRNSLLVGCLVLGFSGLTVPAAQAVTPSSYWTKQCFGPDMWTVKVTTYRYSLLEKILWPYPKDYTTRVPWYLTQHNHKLCASGTKA